MRRRMSYYSQPTPAPYHTAEPGLMEVPMPTRPLIAQAASGLLFSSGLLFASGGLVGCADETVAPADSGSTDPVVAWEAFCDQLKATGVEILNDYPQKHAIDRAEGPRYLAQQLANAVKSTLLADEKGFPLLRIGSTTIDKWGMDGADAKYTQAQVEGDGRYRLAGRLGSAKLIAIQLFTMQPDYQPFAYLSGDALSRGDLQADVH